MSGQSIGDATLRAILRLVPLLPAPEIYDIVLRVLHNQKDVDKQVQEAVEALSRSSALIDDLGTTLKDREAKLRELQAEYQRVSQLASLTEEQGRAVAASMQKVLGETQYKERFIAFIINIIAGSIIFILGVFASDWVKALPQHFTKPPLQAHDSLAPDGARKD